MGDKLREALSHHQRGALTQAERLYREILAETPTDSEALQLLGDIEFQRGQREDAVRRVLPAYRKSPRLHASEADVASALEERKHWWEQVAASHHAATCAPDDPHALKASGNALLALRLPTEALECYDRALRLQPEYSAALYNRGIVLLALKRPEEALASFDRVLALEPDDSEALTERGNALLELGRAEDALVSYARALELAPRSVQALYNRGMVLLDLKRPGDALGSFDRVLAIAPDDVASLNNRGLALLQLQRPGDALASFDRALALQPGLGEVSNNRGNALRDMKRYEDALASYDRALELMPDSAEVHRNRGNVLRELRRFSDAAEAFARLIAMAPEYDYAIGDLANCMLECADWDRLPQYVQAVAEAVEGGKRAALPFVFLAVSQSAPMQLRCSRTFAADRFPASAQPLWTGMRYRHPRIRVAYLSADFHDHATAYLMAEFFERHDKQRFETSAFSFGPDATGGMRERLQRAFERFVDVRGQSDRQVAELLHRLEIDIAVDLKGYTADCRPGILSHRPAPIQVNYLGYPGTMGADYIDYIIADAHVIPQGQEACYSERIVRLPECYQPNDSRRAIAPRTPARSEVNLPPQGFVFCCFNSGYKITPAVFDVWMRLLNAVSGSVLWLLESSTTASRNLRREAERRGVAPERLIFAPRCGLDEHLARHRLADLFLDTLPVNAHTTASDALWAGVPVLTCMGDAFASRVAGSLLNAVGLPELIARSMEDYETMARELATNPLLLAALRARLIANLASCPLFDADRFRRHMEAAYTLMWERWQRGEPPASIAVPSVEESSSPAAVLSGR